MSTNTNTLQPVFRHAAVLNALSDMQQSPAYAVRKSVLAEAEIAIAAADLETARLREINAKLVAALEGIFAQTAKHSRQWGQSTSAAAFARDPATAKAFASARSALTLVKGE